MRILRKDRLPSFTQNTRGNHKELDKNAVKMPINTYERINIYLLEYIDGFESISFYVLILICLPVSEEVKLTYSRRDGHNSYLPRIFLDLLCLNKGSLNKGEYCPSIGKCVGLPVDIELTKEISDCKNIVAPLFNPIFASETKI